MDSAKGNFLDKPRLGNLTNEIWRSAERLRGKFKQYEYQKVVLPMIVLRRLECVLEKKADIRAKRPTIKDADLAKLVKNLEMNDRSLAFYNSTDWTLKKVYEDDSASLEKKFLHEHAAVESVVVEHPEYVEDFEYIPFEGDIETFLKREITTPLIRWAELPQLGYEILPNKYFYKYVPPVSTKELMKSFRLLGRQNNDG